MKQSLLILSTIFFALFLLAGAYIFRARTTIPSDDVVKEDDVKIQVVASFYPLGEFARQVGGDSVSVSAIVPAGVEPHEYEPTPQDIASIYAADVFIANGAGLDAWATKIRPDLESKGVRVIIMSQVLGFDEGMSSVEYGEGGGVDPHFWLDPTLVEKEAATIKDVFISVDIKNQDVYTTNAEGYTQNIVALDQAYRDGLRLCENKTIITSHNAFHYLATKYGFESLSITGFSPESEPSTRQLADLVTLARQKNIQYIFFETLVSPRLAETLANEIGAQTLVFNPLEGLTADEMVQGKNYISVMRENLDNLRLAMDCK